MYCVLDGRRSETKTGQSPEHRRQAMFAHPGVSPFTAFSFTVAFLCMARPTADENLFVPVDLALGWGRMSEDEILKDIDIRQSVRFYSWRAKELPIPKKEISSHSANMRLIPSNREIDERIRDTGEDDVVSFRGYLVRIEGEKGGFRPNPQV